MLATLRRLLLGEPELLLTETHMRVRMLRDGVYIASGVEAKEGDTPELDVGLAQTLIDRGWAERVVL